METCDREGRKDGEGESAQEGGKERERDGESAVQTHVSIVSIELWFPKWASGPLRGSQSTNLGVPQQDIKKLNICAVFYVIFSVKMHTFINADPISKQTFKIHIIQNNL